jgi:uncharacterized membrane protein
MSTAPPPFATNESPEANQSSKSGEAESVWTYRGYRLRPSEFTTAMVHYFRAEVQRANVWRSRLDTTTNWAVVATGAALTIAFSPSGFHGVILLNILMVTIFLAIEARRYRYYELWSARVRLLETDFFAAMLVPPFQPSPDWAESLAEILLHPQFPISNWEAVGRRLRRNYFYIYIVLILAWLAKVALLPNSVKSWEELTSRASVGGIPGESTILVVIIFIVIIIMLGILTIGLHQATGEVLPRFGVDAGIPFTAPAGNQDDVTRPWYRLSRRRQQLIALIITDNGERISKVILDEMKRGVTSIPGTGMYTGKTHAVLLCALTVTEVNHLKQLVRVTDSQAFVIVSPAQEILGRGFVPLNTAR